MHACMHACVYVGRYLCMFIDFGVPQGSILGPPSSSYYYIDDLPNTSTLVQYTLFADDSLPRLNLNR